jgi:hypothetical protein
MRCLLALRKICEFGVECSEARSGVDSGPKSTTIWVWSLVAGLLTFPLAGEATAAKRVHPRKRKQFWPPTFNEWPCSEDDRRGIVKKM